MTVTKVSKRVQGSSEKQNLKRKHGEGKRFGALLIKLTKLELIWTLTTPDLHTKQSFMELHNKFPNVYLIIRSLIETCMGKKNQNNLKHTSLKKLVNSTVAFYS